jgi:leader peptidase (prepilin peptidase)/N-methyltransferase
MVAVLGIVSWRLDGAWLVAGALVFGAGAVAVCSIDIVELRVPTRVVVATGVVLGVVMVLGSLSSVGPGALWGAAVGSSAYGASLSLIHVIAPDGLGAGDARWAWVVGAFVGWAAWLSEPSLAGATLAVFDAIVVAVALGLATHLVLVIWRAHRRALPFAPAMTVGAFVVVLAMSG